MRTLKNIVSLSVGILILSLPFNPVKDIPDKIHLSFLFVYIFLSGIAGISATCLPAKEAGSRLTVVDLWVALMPFGVDSRDGRCRIFRLQTL